MTPATGTRTALVIEDDEDIRALLVTVIGQLGFTVESCNRGAAALELAAALRPDLVTMDLSLPDLDGFTICRRLRTSSDAKLVIVSARADDESRREGEDAGADDYLTKPFSPKELRERVGALFAEGAPSA